MCYMKCPDTYIEGVFFQKGYWGLGEDPQGCRPCDCDVGGAYDSSCDQRSGQCNCRPNVEGRRCDHVRPGFFVMPHDWLRYEAEDARGIGVSNVTCILRGNVGCDPLGKVPG